MAEYWGPTLFIARSNRMASNIFPCYYTDIMNSSYLVVIIVATVAIKPILADLVTTTWDNHRPVCKREMNANLDMASKKRPTAT